METVELQGSEKQIEWATSIRNNMLEAITIIDYYKKEEKIINSKVATRVLTTLEDFKKIIETEVSAKWFIENRTLTMEVDMLGGDTKQVIRYYSLFLNGIVGKEDDDSKNAKIAGKMFKMVEKDFFNYHK